jgi:hypothetical protein
MVEKGISFKEGLSKIAGKAVLVFDPSPTAIPTIARSEMRNLEFLPPKMGPVHSPYPAIRTRGLSRFHERD